MRKKWRWRRLSYVNQNFFFCLCGSIVFDKVMWIWRFSYSLSVFCKKVTKFQKSFAIIHLALLAKMMRSLRLLQTNLYNTSHWDASPYSNEKIACEDFRPEKTKKNSICYKKDAQLGSYTAIIDKISQGTPKMNSFFSLFFSNYCWNFTLHFSFTTVIKRSTPQETWNLFSCKLKSTCVPEALTSQVFFATDILTLDSASSIGKTHFVFP